MSTSTESMIDAALIRSQMCHWWKKWPQANVGLATGAGSGVVVLNADGAEGRATLGTLAGDDPAILDTRIHRTGSGGSHLFYQHPVRLRKRSETAPGNRCPG